MINGNYQDLLEGNIQLSVKKIVFRRCTSEWVMPLSFIDHANLTYVVSGEAEYTLNGRHTRVHQGNLIYVPHGAQRQATLIQENPMRCYSIDFYLRDRQGRFIQLPLPDVSEPADAAIITDLCGKLNVSWLQNDAYCALYVKALLQLLIHQLIRKSSLNDAAAASMDDRIRSIMEYTSRHYSRPLSLAHFADQLNLNKVYLGMVFKQNTGMSFHQYLTNARLNAAEELLYSGKYTISEVAYMTGFQDPSYFSRVFCTTFGVRPGRYKRIEKPTEPPPPEEMSGKKTGRE